MADEAWRMMAVAAGLADALRDYPGDVEAAARAALRAATGLQGPVDPVVEPWPPMLVAGAA